MDKVLSPEQRLQNFNALTRQSLKSIETKSSLSESTEYTINLPKTRYLSNVFIKVNATLTATHATETAYTPHEDAPFKFLNRVVLDMNDGFLPISLTGQALAAYNRTLYKNAATLLTPATSGQRKQVVQGLTASSGGTANTVSFILQLPITLNPRDSVGLINLQGDQQLGTVRFSLGAVGDLAPAASGFTFAVSAISVSVYTESYTIPAPLEARPDTTVLKQVMESTHVISASENTIKLMTMPGLLYRKIGFILYSSANAKQLDSIITSNIKLILNQNDTPIDITPYLLAQRNTQNYGVELPKGEFVFDFADQGLTNMGGTRDWIDSSDMTELWLQFTSSAAGFLKVWTEQIHMAKSGGKTAI